MRRGTPGLDGVREEVSEERTLSQVLKNRRRQPSREDEGECFRQREQPGERLGMFVTTASQMSSLMESLGGICF